MQIKSLIEVLQKLYDSYDDEYKMVMGEPEIMIDVFQKVKDHKFEYGGFHNEIVIEKSSDGVYDIISAFAETYEEQKCLDF